MRHFRRNRYNPIFRVEAPMEGCTEEICQHPMFYQSVQHLQLHPLEGIEPTSTFFKLPGPSLYKHLTVFHPQEAKKRALKRDCTEESCVDHKYQNAVKYLQENLKAEIVVTSRNFQLKPGSFRHHLEVYHPAEVIKRRRKSDCTEDVCINIEFRPAVDYLQQYSQAKIEPTERHFQLSRGRLRSHLAMYHPQEIKRRSPKRDCVETICVDPKYHFATEYKFEHPQDSIRSVAKKFSLIPGSLLHHLSRYHAQSGRQDRHPNVRHFHRNRRNPFRVAAPQQTATCTEEICIHPRFQIAVEYLQQHPEDSIHSNEKRFELPRESLRNHVESYHTQEAKKRQMKSDCTEKECINSNYQTAVEYLQKHPKEGIQQTERRFKIPLGALRGHVEFYHPQEVEKRQLRSNCAEEECLNLDYQDAVEYLQKHPKEGIKQTEKRFKLSIHSLRIHVKSYHPQEAKKRQRKFDCTAEKCINSTYQAAVKYLQKHFKEGIQQTERKFNLPLSSLRSHVKVYHPQEAEKRQLESGCKEEECINPKYQDAIDYLQKHSKEGIKQTAEIFELPEGSLRSHVEVYHPQEAKKRQLESNCTEEECINSKYQDAVDYLQQHPKESIRQIERRFELSQNSLRSHVEIYHPQEAEKRRRKPIRRYNPIFRVEAPQQTNTCTEEICAYSRFQAAVDYLQQHPKASMNSTERRFGLPARTLRGHVVSYHPQEAKKRQKKKSNCTAGKCLDEEYQAAVDYLQHHFEAGWKHTAEKFEIRRGSLQRHVVIRHPQEAKKRQLKSDCTAEKCSNAKYKASVVYLQRHPKVSIASTERRFKLIKMSLRNHLDEYHPLELQKRQRESDCTEEECVHPMFQVAITFLQQHSEAGIAPTGERLDLKPGSLRNHLAAYHPLELQKRQRKSKKQNVFFPKS